MEILGKLRSQKKIITNRKKCNNDKSVSVKEYFDEIKPYVKDIINIL